MYIFKILYSILFILLNVVNVFAYEQQKDLTNEERDKLGLPKVSEYFTHILTFGDESSGTSREFLLVEPRIPGINANGDIIVFDENKFKIFDKTGKGKLIFGREGKGPGEFYGRFSAITVSPEGFISVTENMVINPIPYHTIYDPQYNFIYKKRYDILSLMNDYLNKNNLSDFKYKDTGTLRSLNETIKVFSSSLKKDPNDIDYYYTIGCDNNGKFVPIVFKKLQSKAVRYKKYSSSSTSLSDMYFHRVLPDNVIAYYVGDVSVTSKTSGTYTIHLYSH